MLVKAGLFYCRIPRILVLAYMTKKSFACQSNF